MKKKKKKERKKTGRETLTEEEFCGDSYAFVSHQRRDRDEGVKGMPPLLVGALLYGCGSYVSMGV